MSDNKQAIALVDCTIAGVAYKCNALINATAKEIAQAEKDGVADSNAAAVAKAEKPKKADKPVEDGDK